jgi:Uncharacterized conserved protein
MYYKKKGPVNTAQTVKLALETAQENGIRHIVVASSSGKTALQFVNDKGVEIICVTYAYGFSVDGQPSMDDTMREQLKEKSIPVLATTHVLSGVERALSSEYGGMYPAEIMANTLRMLGQGVKVCVEISVMALDAGLIPHGERVIVVGGSGTGADTAVVITPAHAKKVFQTQIHQILCKPL